MAHTLKPPETIGLTGKATLKNIYIYFFLNWVIVALQFVAISTLTMALACPYNRVSATCWGSLL